MRVAGGYTHLELGATASSRLAFDGEISPLQIRPTSAPVSQSELRMVGRAMLPSSPDAGRPVMPAQGFATHRPEVDRDRTPPSDAWSWRAGKTQSPHSMYLTLLPLCMKWFYPSNLGKLQRVLVQGLPFDFELRSKLSGLLPSALMHHDRDSSLSPLLVLLEEWMPLC